MALAEIRNIEKAYAGRSVLKGITFDLQKGERIGLVGANGSGKTTLLKIIAGVEQADHGAVAIAKACKLAYVSQIPTMDPEQTLHHQVSQVFEEVHELERRLHQAAEDLARHPEGEEGGGHEAAVERYTRLETEFNHMRGYDIARRVDAILHELGFTQRDLEMPIKMLSGGQKSRAQLARLLLEGPDLMLLDEPTNHLDLPMLDWLENTIAEMEETAMVVVSHDRYFLDSVVDEVFDLVDGKIETYPGNYSAYTDLKVQRQLSQQRAYDQQQAYIAKEEEYIRRFGAGQRAKQARGRKKRLDRLKAGGMSGLVETTKLVEAVRRDGKKMILDLEVKKPSGFDVLKVKGLSKGYPGKPLLEGVSFNLTRGKRIGIIGPNGSGKSTLLNILAGENEADAGEFKWGHGVSLEFFRQEHQTLNLENTILEEFQAAKITATQQEIRDLAGLLLFSGDTIEKRVGVLSGGERARVAMGKMLLNPSNTIFMDEPTNHLDMPTCEVLEAALDTYDGAALIISHDRYFLDQVCDQLLVLRPPHLPGAAWKLYPGSYSDYLEFAAKEKAAAATRKEADRKAAAAAKRREQESREREKRKAAAKTKAKTPQKFGKLTVQELEQKITQMESDLASLEESFANPRVTANPQAMKELAGKYEQGKRDLAELMAAWEAKAEEE
ncbi:MAG: ABC-F family ATP-binding cassette domain-containing protein [Phycisphaerales bacterium]|nr:ABC-F family ATP-binding cassette domain-containing protein [Phycisphaerales bacterium]